MSFLSQDPVTSKIEIDVLVQRGQWKDAESILIRMLAAAAADAKAVDQISLTTRRTTPVDDSPEVQKNKLMLAHIFRQVGRPQDAESIDKDVLATRQRLLGPDAQDTLVVMYHLATDIKLQPERLLEGLALEEYVLEAAAQIYWPDAFADSPTRSITTGPSKSAIDNSPAMDILIRMCHVADTFFMQNQAAQAARLHETVLRLSTTALGPGHPYTIAVMDSTGRDYVSQGRLPEAVRLLQDAAEAGKVHLGSRDSTTRRCIVHLAEAHGRMTAEGDGKVPDTKTISILEQAIKILEESIGHDETDTISLKYYLAVAYARLDGRFRESEALQNQVLGWCRRQLGNRTVTANLMVRNLVLMYRQLGRMDKAREIENEFGRIRRSIS
ncbi:conserved hypothetical protein [Talaromyces marneffei ATCC 18224]|uniref:Kinesin light chain n=2 Tax=Talaromyces marneffei TaxID=37727 RepID=B6QAM5_TALMQ|nr:conserved hypothetical protein [Talaromyces marneffei ATCC 18224]